MKFLLLVAFMNAEHPNYIHSHYESYAECVSHFSDVDRDEPVSLQCAQQADYVALVIDNLDTSKSEQYSVYYSYQDCKQAIFGLSLDYNYRPYCTQYQD